MELYRNERESKEMQLEEKFYCTEEEKRKTITE